MLDLSSMYGKALEVIRKCCHRDGFFASTDSYRGQLWLRDLYYSVPGLLRLGYKRTVIRQYVLTMENVKDDGEVPDFIFAYSLLKHLKVNLKTLHGRFLDFPYRPWVCDTPLLFIIGLKNFIGEASSRPLREKIGLVRRYIETKRDSYTGLILGADYRDSLLFNSYLLSNQADLYMALKLLGEGKEAERVKESIEEVYWDKKLGHYRDTSNGERFDTLAHVKLIKYGLIDGKRTELIVEKFNKVSTRYGFVNVYPPYTRKELEADWRECGRRYDIGFVTRGLFSYGVRRNMRGDYQNGTIWPFVHNMVVEVLLDLGYEKEAMEHFKKIKGFYEYYDPVTGRGMGSGGQLWSAATWIHLYERFMEEGFL
ncbi:MAG: hypothetical protein DRJ98_05150 [Thermoprotei archaeon]|nr:MAG: hypothetical protein DRJ98_05150 [Thermoprotei archaeon]